MPDHMPSPGASERYAAIRFSGYTARIKKLSLNNDYSRYGMEYSSTPLHIGERFMWSERSLSPNRTHTVLSVARIRKWIM
jgi:hypothetical protein